jgi:hypothetical protein
MKRLFHMCVIWLLLTGSWGALTAAAFCPRAQGHACCHAKSSAREHSHEAASAHDGMMMADMEDTSAASAFVGDVGAVEQPPDSCPHCMGHSGLPYTEVVLANAPGPSARDMSAATPEAQESFIPLASSFAPKVISRQHAPPGTSAQHRHVLISVFLI